MSDLIAGVERVTAESGGALNVSIVTSQMGVELIGAAILGDPEAAMLLRAITESAAWIRRAPRRTPTLCICCPRPIRRVTPRTVFGVAAPAKAHPSRAIGFAFCEKCGTRPDELMGKATPELRKIWPELRPIEITHPAGGRA